MPHSNITYVWRDPFTNREIHQLHAAAFETRLFDESEWDWVRDGATGAGCEFLHVGFDQDLESFYIDACGFRPTLGGLMELT